MLGSYEQALEVHMHALKLYQFLFQQNHEDVARSLNCVGGVLFRLGRLNEGLEYILRALRMQ